MQSRILADNQITRIHHASLAILERTGVLVPHEDMLNRFEDAGATVRFSFSMLNNEVDIETTLTALQDIVPLLSADT